VRDKEGKGGEERSVCWAGNCERERGRVGYGGSGALSACLAITERLSCILKFLRVSAVVVQPLPLLLPFYIALFTRLLLLLLLLVCVVVFAGQIEITHGNHKRPGFCLLVVDAVHGKRT